MENTTLYYREGSSDKIYQASLQPHGDLWVVNFAFGRRGTTLSTGTKTSVPVEYARAKAIYDKLVREKTAKGYTPGESGTPYRHTDKANQATGILPQLLNPIDQQEADRLIGDPQWVMQQKFDGRRMLIRRTRDGIEGINRSGLIVALPDTIMAAVQELRGDFIIDGESLNDGFVAFDILELTGTDCRPLPYGERLSRLWDLVRDHGHLSTADTTSQTLTKRAMLESLRSGNAEGAVFKRHDAPYTPGRPASGGTALKLKFYETASFLVSQINQQRSISLALLAADRVVAAGNVTIPPNHVVPPVGAIIEARYLYAFRESGCVYQPIYLGRRHDIEAAACTVRQLKFKSAS